MKKLVVIIFLLTLMAQPVSATEYTAPVAPSDAQEYLPESSGSFTEDLWYVIKKAFGAFFPSLSEAAGSCVSVLGICMLVSILKDFNSLSARTVELIGTIGIAAALLVPSNALINTGVDTTQNISEYTKVFAPVITAALATEGGTASSASLYSGTILFNTILTIVITKLLIPLLYIYIALSIARSAISEPMLDNMQKFIKWLMTWILKISIYVFTGYIGITGVISGHVDASAVKATKIAISGSVPVIGNIISDASETILVSAGLMKNAVGTYGLLAVIAIWIGPFLKIGAHYLVLKLTGSVSGIFGSKKIVALIDDFSSAMGYLAAMTGTLCLLFFISTVCFMRGVG